MKEHKLRDFFPWIVLIPILTWYGIFVFYPALKDIFMSFYLWNITDPSQSKFVGLRHYLDFRNDARFIISFKNTWIYVILKTALSIPISLITALFLVKISKGRNILLFCLLLPYFMSAAAMGILWRWLYQPSFGLFNNFLKALSLPPQKFLNSPHQALYSIIMVDIWRSVGFGTVIFQAARLNIPEIYYEAARIDGANHWKLFRCITLPLLGNTSLFMLIITVIGAFQVFDIAMVMTIPELGGPGRSTYILSLLVYNQGINRVRMGYAAAVAMVMFIIMIILTVFQFRILRRRWAY